MIYTQSSFLKNNERNLIQLSFALSILFSQCAIGNSDKNSMVLRFNLNEASTDGKINFQCNYTSTTSHNNHLKTFDESELCRNASFDAIFTYKDETFILKGEKYWKHINNGFAAGYPKLISQKWHGLPSNIDTAFVDAKDKFIYFFKGSQFWKFNGDEMDADSPTDTQKEFPGVPENARAALIWKENGNLYFFQDKFHYEIDISQRPYQEAAEKKLSGGWRGLPPNVEAALQSTGSVTYFFKGEKYYKYDDKVDHVAVADPPYPRRVASNWFGCPKILKITEE